MNQQLVDDLQVDYPKVFKEDAEITIGVGWYSLAKEVTSAIQKVGAKIESLESKRGGMVVRLSCEKDTLPLAKTAIKEYLHLSKTTCEICGTSGCEEH